MLVVSFTALAALWKQPVLGSARDHRTTPEWVPGFLLARGLRVALQAISAGLLALVFAAALVGEADSDRNLAPTWIYVVFWLGLPLLSILLGDIWRAL